LSHTSSERRSSAFEESSQTRETPQRALAVNESTSANVPSDRLDSWKAIAAYFDRDVRTVRRWESNQQLPVHRHLHNQRSAVYAYSSELERWWRSRSAPPHARTRLSTPPKFRWYIGALAFVFALLGIGLWQTWSSSTIPRPTRVSDARALCGRGQFLLDRRMGWRRFLPILHEAVVRDPSFAPAQAALAEAYRRRAVLDPDGREAAWREADRIVRKALLLDNRLPAAHATLGSIYLSRDWDWAGARKQLQHAVELDPADTRLRASFAFYLRMAGRLDDAIAERRRIVESEPLKAEHLAALGMEYLFARRDQDAVKAFRQALELEPGYQPALTGLSEALRGFADTREAQTWTRRLLAFTRPTSVVEAFEATARAHGFAAAARRLDRDALEKERLQPVPNLWTLACGYARLGETEAAFRSLEAAVERRDPAVLQMRIDPDLDGIRSDPRFVRLLRRLGNPL
jgi:tetratricopeptide (TPR) repeat protein